MPFPCDYSDINGIPLAVLSTFWTACWHKKRQSSIYIAGFCVCHWAIVGWNDPHSVEQLSHFLLWAERIATGIYRLKLCLFGRDSYVWDSGICMNMSKNILFFNLL